MTEDTYSILMPTIQEEDLEHQSDPEDSLLRPTKEDIHKRIETMYTNDSTTMCIYCIVCSGFISLIVVMCLAAWKIQA